MEDMEQLSDQSLKLFGENGREKVKVSYNEKLVIDKYVNTIRSFQKAS
jgi:hypothetical protein